MHKITIGCDPEVFVRNPNSGSFVSAHGLIKGTKDSPFRVFNGAVQVDGMALEFNTDPAETVSAFIHNVTSVYGQLGNMVSGYNLIIEPVAVFPKEHFDACPDEAKAMGCDPDFDAWTEEANTRPDNVGTMRTAAGHIHIGWGEFDPYDMKHFESCCAIARHLDYYLGVNSLLWDGNDERRSLYGKAGAFRPKPYGIEYRVLSNAWLRDPRLMGWCFTAAKRGIIDYLDGTTDPVGTYGEMARTIINSGDVVWPNKYPNMFGTKLPKLPSLKRAA